MSQKWIKSEFSRNCAFIALDNKGTDEPFPASHLGDVFKDTDLPRRNFTIWTRKPYEFGVSRPDLLHQVRMGKIPKRIMSTYDTYSSMPHRSILPEAFIMGKCHSGHLVGD